MYLNITAVGRLGRSVTMRYTPDGKAVADFSMASDVGFGENKKTVWLRVTTWQKTAEACNNYLDKGSKVLISGTLNPDENGSPRIWNKQDGTPATSYEVTAQTVRFLDSRGEGQSDEQLMAGEEECPF